MDIKDIVISKTFLDGWRKRWTRIHDTRWRNDYELAQLLNEIRLEFPKGDAGDLQFGLWMRKHLQGARNTPLLLAKAHAFDVFDEAQWIKLGGWPSISFLMTLSRADRGRVLATLAGEGPYHYATVRMRAIKLGIVAKRKRRDTRSRSEARVDVLRRFIVKLYQKRHDLPTIPAEVKQALTPTVLSMLPVEVRA